MEMNRIRSKVSALYPGRWPARVARMPDDQVLAIYLSTKNRHQKPVKKTPKKVVERQMTIYDFL